MIRHSVCAALLVVWCCLSAEANAATCRSGEAATTGSQAGYQEAKRASDAWAEREKTVSDQMQDCLSRIRTTSVNLPSFPSLQDLLNKVADKVCQAAVDKVNSHIPGSIDPWEGYQSY